MLFPLDKSLQLDGSSDSDEGVLNKLLRISENIATSHPLYRSTFVGTTKDELDRILPTGYINVDSQVPLWIRTRNEDSNVKLVLFFQKYYDWLYSQNGSEYVLDDRFENIKDIDKCPDELIYYMLSTFLPEYQRLTDIIILDAYGDDSIPRRLVSIDATRNFLSAIKDRFYRIKGTPQSIEYFFNTLLGAASVDVTNEGDTTYQLSISWQDLDVPKEDYEDYYLEYVHPVGVGHIFNTSATNVSERSGALGGGDSGGFSGDIPQFTAWEELTYGDGAYDGTGDCEPTIVGNYFPYTQGYTLDIAVSAGCCGSTIHGGISGGATGNTANMLTYAFPDWSTAVPIAGSSFGLINIYDFACLEAGSGNTSPNDGRQDNYSCPAGGYS